MPVPTIDLMERRHRRDTTSQRGGMNIKTFTSKLSSSLLAGVVAITAMAGCDTAPAEPLESEPTIALRAQGVEGQLQSDGRFKSVLDLTADIAIAAVLQQQSMSEEDIDATVRMLNHPDYAENFAQSDLTLPELALAVGFDPDLLAAQGALMSQLAAEYGLEGQQVAEAFDQALTAPASRHYVTSAIRNRLEAEGIVQGDSEGTGGSTGDDGSDTEGDCEDPCEATLAEAIGAASVQMTNAMAAALNQSNWFLKVGAIIAASAKYAADLARATRAHRECREECYGFDLTDECAFDSECDADEYCFKGVLGIGKNQCRPLKGVGLGCARPTQCDTGCCKYHPGTNPFSKTCRPADRCE